MWPAPAHARLTQPADRSGSSAQLLSIDLLKCHSVACYSTTWCKAFHQLDFAFSESRTQSPVRCSQHIESDFIFVERRVRHGALVLENILLCSCEELGWKISCLCFRAEKPKDSGNRKPPKTAVQPWLHQKTTPIFAAVLFKLQLMDHWVQSSQSFQVPILSRITDEPRV